jgi:branched-chain amino acid transport system permease protein
MDAGADRRRTALAIGAFVALVGLYPLLFSGGYFLGVGIAAGAMAAATVGFVLLIGYAHQLALGQPAFCMIGGYANAVLCVKFGWDPAAAMLLGAGMAMVLAWMIGTPILRLSGFYLAMASLALQLVMIYGAKEWPFLGSALGIHGVPKFAVFGLRLDQDIAYYYVVWIIVLAAIAAGLAIDRSRIGRALKAIAASEPAAGAAGIDITRYKVQMFVVSAGLASISGSLTVHYLRVMEPDVFGFAYSLNIITACIAGGLMSIWGGAVGATLITGLREVLREVKAPNWEPVIMGALTVLILIAFRQGLAGFVRLVYDRATGAGAKGERTSQAAAPDPAALARLPSVPEKGRVLLDVAGVSRSFGSLKAVADVSFTVRAGEITALIGPNGAGKTTMFNLVTGHQPVDAGAIRFDEAPIHDLLPDRVAGFGVGRTFQNLQLFDNMSVLDNVMCGHHRHMKAGLAAVVGFLPAVRREEAAARAAALAALRFVGLEGAAGLMPGALPFGHLRLVEIARALAARPTLLLMDEPASGLNDTETERLAELILHIAALGTTVLLVEHDIRLVMGLADRVVVMHHGEKIADGPTDLVRADARVVSAYLGS